MYCLDVPVRVPLNYKAMCLNLTAGLEENILSVQESLRDVSTKHLFCFFSPVLYVGILFFFP